MQIQEALQDKVVRIEAMRDNFALFFAFHFGRKFTEFQKDWMRSLQSDKNSMIVAFRASRKTTMVRGYVVRCICYKHHSSIIWQSYENRLSADSVREIAKMLCSASIVRDYGELFPMTTKKEDLAKRSLSNFECTNGVRLASKSLGQTLRGTNTYDMQDGISARPTLLILDDVDVTDSVSNPLIINDNETKIKTETIGAMDPLRRKIVFLGNIIQEDGVVPRFINQVRGSEGRDLFYQPLITEKGENMRPEVFTEEVITELQDTEGKTGRSQNYLLIPSTLGTGIFIRQYFDYFLLSHFEDASGVLEKSDVRSALYIDPAFSTNSKSDDAVIIHYGQHKITKKRYLLDGYANTSAPSSTISAVITMYNKAIYDGRKPEYISVENVYLNNNQTQFIQLLRDELVRMNIHCPLVMYEPKGKKEQRIKDILEPVMSQKAIKFSKNIADPSFIMKMEKQFLEFPNGDHDDIIDTITQAEEMMKRRPEEQKKQIPQKKPGNYNPY